MNMNIYNNLFENYSLLDILSKKSRTPKINILQSSTITFQNVKSRDSVSISAEAKSKAIPATKGNHQNTDIDKTIDLQKYIDKARVQNEEAMKNVGDSINRNAVKYTDLYQVFKEALNDKYAKASAGACAYSSNEEYLHDKYYNVNSAIYESDLSQEERRIGYINEQQYLKNGTVRGLHTGDSLFRGIEINGDICDNDRVQWNRRVISKQIDNITQKAGIDIESIPEECTFNVDPYSKYISVENVSADLKYKMEQALNVGDNGKNLYFHLLYTTVQDGCNSTQRNEQGYKKYQAYSRVNEYTGLKLNELEQRDGGFYTNDGENVLTLVNKGIDEKVPQEAKSYMKNWIEELVTSVAKVGWDNIPDMILKVEYGKGGLKDIGQDIIYDGYTRLNDSWYSVL